MGESFQVDKYTAADLAQRQSLPLEAKVAASITRIKEWLDHWDGAAFVGFSGGNNSSILANLVRQVDKEVPLVFSNTGLEYPEIVEFVTKGPFQNVVVVRPQLTFKQVLDQYGYPVVDRKSAQALRNLQNPTDRNENSRRLAWTGIKSDGQPGSPASKLADKWRYLVEAPFKISEKCCDKLKKFPLDNYAKETGRKPFIGLLAGDSSRRKRGWMVHGCNAYQGTLVHSAPLAIWTAQDCLEYHLLNPGLLAPVYGQILRGEDGQLHTTGEQRTGCIFCCFGLDQEYRSTGTHRFLRMEVSHPKLYAYCMEQLGFREVITTLKLPYTSKK